ncbi:hypothetical protein, partial [Rhizobium johnstonii]|uniref:hypothetical protein n=1 Tax=Rhizobium johnstonii TaxID=3019933 RepID=UPI003F94B261
EAEWKIRPTAQWLAEYGLKMDDIRVALGWAFSGNRSVATSSPGRSISAAKISSERLPTRTAV